MAKEAKIPKVSNSKILSIANNEFSNDLYQFLLPKTKWSSGNMIFSSFSLHAALGMVGQGAEGDTRSEILHTLNLEDESENDAIGETYQEVISGFPTASSQTPFTLLTANKVYCKTGFPLNMEFVEGLKEHFLVDFEQLDFTSSGAVPKMNNWVAKATENKIKNLFAPRTVNKDTSLVLVNAIYFKGLWSCPFNVSKTSKKKFHVTPSKEVNVNMMRKNSTFAYRDLPKLNAHAVSLPYKGGRLSMVIVLPKAIDGLAEVQRNLGSLLEDGKRIVNRNSWSPDKIIELSLPKFTIEASLDDLKKVLKNMGMELAFSRYDADFSGIPRDPKDENTQVFVSDIAQKAFIEVDEKGTKAAAATRVTACLCTCTRRPPKTHIPFVVDHPFYFQIVDHANDDLILFAGHCNDPTK